MQANTIQPWLKRWIVAPLRSFSPSALVASVLIAVINLVATAYCLEGSVSAFFADRPFGTVARFVLVAVVFYVALTLLYHAYDVASGGFGRTLRSAEHGQGGMPKFRGKDSDLRRFLVIALVIFAAWMLIWIIPHFPGTIRDDTIPQLLQYDGLYGWYTQHPVVDSLIFGCFWDLGKALGSPVLGLGVFIVAQAALTAAVFSYGLVYLMRNGVPRWVVYALILVICLARVFYQPVDTVSKDAISAPFFLISVICFFECLRTESEWLKSPTHAIALVVFAVLAILTKRTMLYVLAALAVVLFIQALVKRRKSGALRIAGSYGLAVIVAVFLVTPAVNSVLNAYQSKTNEMYSIPVQQIVGASSTHYDELSEEQLELAAQVINLPMAIEVYNPTRSDEATAYMLADADVSALLQLWVSLGVEYPREYLGAFANMTCGWLTFEKPLDYAHDLSVETTGEKLDFWVNAMFSGDRAATSAYMGNFSYERSALQNAWYAAAETFDTFMKDHALWATSYGFWCFALPFSIFCWALSRRNWKALAATVPAVMLLASMMVGPVALYWYSIPMVYLDVLLVGAPIAVLNQRTRCLDESEALPGCPEE